MYYYTYYVPNNMAIAISGDIDIEETIALIDQEFSLWQKKKLPKSDKWKEPKIKKVERVEVTFPGEERAARLSHSSAHAQRCRSAQRAGHDSGQLDGWVDQPQH